MFQNPGFIQTNKPANKLTNKLPRPMLIAVGSSKGNIVLDIKNNFGSILVSGILNHFLRPRPQAQGRIPRPTPPLPGEARLRQRRPRPRHRPRLKQEGGQTLPKSSHSRRSRKVSALYKEHIRKCHTLGRPPELDFQGPEPGGQPGPPRRSQSRGQF